MKEATDKEDIKIINVEEGHLEGMETLTTIVEIGENVYSQIRQIDYLLSKSRELKLRSRHDFEDNYDEIKDIVSAQTLFGVDDALEQLETVTVRVMQRREDLRSKTIR